ncbi:MAG: hypothetical protein KDD47_07405, partial [Acidobacteria bacterium]|nr:hypothetical protein [Acidobacteriota bacterium]
LGGRLDATNAGEPVLSVLSPIGLDHQEHLGSTLPEIAREKAGILRPGIPAVAWIDDPSALATVRGIAAELGSPFQEVPAEVKWQRHGSLGWSGQYLDLATPRQRLSLALPFLGEHQLVNLSLAVRAAEVLETRGFPRLQGQALVDGVAACRWPGRLEVVELPGGRRVLLDAAHNSDGARRLRSFLDFLDGDLDLLFGVLADKDHEAILGALAPRFRRIVLTRPESSRARPPEELAHFVARDGSASVEASLPAALDEALETLANGGASTLVACGSIYLVGPVRTLLRRRFGVPAPAAEILTGPEGQTSGP